MVRLLALDLDGTLLNERKHVLPSAIDALRQADAAGMTIALCSGRNHADALHISRLLGIPVWSVSTNGAYLGHSVTGMLRTQPLPLEKAAQAIRISYQFQAAPCLYTPMREYNDTGYLSIARESIRRGQFQLENPDKIETEVASHSEWDAILSQEDGNIMKCISFLPDSAHFPDFRAALDAEGGLTVTTSIMFGGLVASVEINREGVTKGGTLSFLQKHLGISAEETLCFGDSGNDLSMLPCGRFIAMGNAGTEIQSQAFAVTACNNEDGIAQALERFAFAGRI